MRKLCLILASVAITATGYLNSARASTYPSKPITLIVPSGTGGDADRLARAVATYMTKEIHSPVVVEDRPGAAQLIGTKYFLQQPADGYTFMVTSALPYLATNIFLLHAKFTLGDFDFIDNIWQDDVGIYAKKSLPYKTLPALIDAIRAHPGKYSASVIYGSSGQIGLLALEKALNLPLNAINIVTFDGGGDTKTAVAGGTVDFTANQVNGMQTIKDSVIPLAVFSAARIPAFDGPTMNEELKAYNATVPNISGSTRAFLSLPAMRKKYPGRYQFIVSALQKTLARPDFQEFVKSQTMEGNWIGPDKSKAVIYENYAAWQKYVALLKK